jgi:hypothetical protein
MSPEVPLPGVTAGRETGKLMAIRAPYIIVMALVYANTGTSCPDAALEGNYSDLMQVVIPRS